jgi:mRNA-degrading endonuclease YafQ of YafQ-DinJ toxin-antitoxin module
MLSVRRDMSALRYLALMSRSKCMCPARGFHDQALSGTWSGYRSCRLNIQYRLIDRVIATQQLFQVVEVTPHDYRKR